jgi:hypothetical protein
MIVFFESSADDNPGKGQLPWPLSCSTPWFGCIVSLQIGKAYQIFSTKPDKFWPWQVINSHHFPSPNQTRYSGQSPCGMHTNSGTLKSRLAWILREYRGKLTNLSFVHCSLGDLTTLPFSVDNVSLIAAPFACFRKGKLISSTNALEIRSISNRHPSGQSAFFW